MSTEQEISFMHLVEVKRDLEKQVRELTHRLDLALESEVACAEQRQLVDMAEEREKKLREALERLGSLPCGAGSGERSMKATIIRITNEALQDVS